MLLHPSVAKQNLHPLEFRSGYGLRPGNFGINGAIVVPGGVSFTLRSERATGCELLLFKRQAEEPYAVIPFPDSYKVGNVFSMIVFGLDISEFEYCFRLSGPYDPAAGLLFDAKCPLLDPYAKAVTGQSTWGEKGHTDLFPYRARVVSSDFEWRDEVNPLIPMSDLIIYELHVRGFTKDPSAAVSAPGTFRGLQEKIPYLKQLGVNAVELMPIFEFDELNDLREYKGEKLVDYWGYNPVSFFAPNTAYAASREFNREGDELKSLIRELHHNGIEVFLDVVYNHTAEGDENGPVINFKGVDNQIYYLLGPDGRYLNFSGCGNTVNCNHPIVRELIQESLRYWATEYRVDGFRFDLASILARGENGDPLQNPPLLESLARDPLLSNVKLVAEAWDAAGMYQVGNFPSWKRWSEWNGRYRDDMRCFLKGDGGYAETATRRILGSSDIYNKDLRGRDASVNFLTCHDGFTLHDLYAYNEKHNLANGWDNTDGENNNNSWNCGAEGETDDPLILALRRRLQKNAFASLLCSRGTPLFLAGDEFGNSQQGNNNPYCQDNEVSWLNWQDLETNRDLFDFVRAMIRLRKHYSLLRRSNGVPHCGYPEKSLHGHRPYELDSRHESRYAGIMLAGPLAGSGFSPERSCDEFIYLGFNMHWEEADIELPVLPDRYMWKLMLDTAAPAGREISAAEAAAPLVDGRFRADDRSVFMLVGKHELVR